MLCVVFVLMSCANPLDKLSSTELLNLGDKYLLELDYEKAVVYFEKLISVDPMNPTGYTGLAEAQNGLGNTSSAIDTLKKGMSIFSNYIEQKIEFLKLLIKIDQTNPEWYLSLAEILKSNDIQGLFDGYSPFSGIWNSDNENSSAKISFNDNINDFLVAYNSNILRGNGIGKLIDNNVIEVNFIGLEAFNEQLGNMEVPKPFR